MLFNLLLGSAQTIFPSWQLGVVSRTFSNIWGVLVLKAVSFSLPVLSH